MTLPLSRQAKAGVVPIAKLEKREKPARGLTRRTRLKQSPGKLRRAPVSPATPEQKAKVAGKACVAAGYHECAGPVDPMHLIDRSLAPSAGDDVLMVVPGCRALHDAYDNHEIDLSPFLEPQFREEVACAVRAVGLFQALRRITNLTWHPVEEAA